MVRQPFDLLGYPLPGERLQGLDDAGMQHPPPLVEQAAIGHLVGEGVLEGVDVLGKEARLVEELRRLEVRQATMQAASGSSAIACTRARAPPCQSPLRSGADASPPVAGGRRALPAQRARSQARAGCAQASRYAPGSPTRTRLDQGPDALFQKKGIALGARDQQPLERPEAGIVPEQRLQGVRAGGRQRVEPELHVRGLTPPRLLILRAIVHKEEDACRRQAVDEAVEERLGLSIDPVQVLADEQHRLDLTFAHQEALERVEGPLAALRRIEGLPRAVVYWHIQEREHGRQGRCEGGIQSAQFAVTRARICACVIAFLS